MRDKDRIKFLEETHRMTDKLIIELEEHNPHSDKIRTLKKLKLKYKDELEALKNDRLRKSII